MAGHSKWANIKHRKDAQDRRRSRLFTRIIRELYIAVKEAGPDPEGNPRLRMAIKNARKVSIPRDTIEKAIKKGAGADGESFEEITLEGYGPHGVAISVECLTDNTNRTIPNIRMYFSKYGGALGKNGSVSYLFERKGIFVFPIESRDEETVALDLLDHGLEDLQTEEGNFIASCAFEDFGQLNARLEALSIEAESSLQRIPMNTVALSLDQARQVLKLLDVLEEDDDVQNVFHTLAFTDELAEALQSES
jgi:YebC/PmpR family DNA-binding regulatory protein